MCLRDISKSYLWERKRRKTEGNAKTKNNVVANGCQSLVDEQELKLGTQ